MPQALALVDDIFFQARILETARQLGVEMRACSTAEALLAAVAVSAPRLVVVDLNARGNPIGAIEQMQSQAPQIPLIAFLSHVQTELAERARLAGCRAVMPRSQFTRNLATILGQAKSESA
ncbi:MAG TPA: hypothetical protein VN661_01245 [Candidatus Acidoferrales bacterium]|nr:hypothetical protein [Candidatus Acidoferrales bacterium]